MEVLVTTFYNPHKFWIFPVRQLTTRQSFEKQFDNGNYPRISAPTVGQLVLTYKERKWRRTLVLSIETPFVCWLVDHGVEYIADSVYEIPLEFVAQPPFAIKASLKDVVCLQREFTTTGMRLIGEVNFTLGSEKWMADRLENADKILFKCLGEIGNTHLAQITIVRSKTNYDLTAALTKAQVLLYDQDTFKTAVQVNGDFEKFSMLPPSPCSEVPNESLGVGRGFIRGQLQLSPKGDSLSDKDSSNSSVITDSPCSDNNSKRSVKIKKKLEEYLGKKSAESEGDHHSSQNLSHASDKSEEISSQPNYQFGEVARKHLTNNCSCEQCLGWSEGNFYFNARTKSDEVQAKCYKRVKPELLLKTEEESGVPVQIKSPERLPLGKIERTVKPTVLIHSSTVLTPATSINAAPFHKDIHKALRSYEHVYTNQGYVWPAIMRHMNVCIVGKKDSGKTLAYLPGICTFVLEHDERYPELPRRTVSPISVILCPRIAVAEKVYQLVLKLLENASAKTHVALAVQPVDKICLNQFEKKVDILVATPVTLLSLLSSRIITLKRLCHLVIEKANEVLEKFGEETQSVLSVTQSMLSHRNGNYTVQMVITAEKWTYPIENLLKSLLIAPVVCISSYLEAAMYGRVDLRVQFLEKKLKIVALIKILKGRSDISRTVVLCNTDEEIKEAREFLIMAGVNCLYITEDMDMVEVNSMESAWLKTVGGKHLALLCTENVFNCSITITNAVMLIHYSLPATWTEFVNRFRCMIDNYTSPLLGETNDNWTRCTADILMDESCVRQFPKVVQLMKRLGGKLSPDFLQYYETTLEEVEAAKLNLKIDVCTNLKLFGKCESFSCEMRHLLSNEVDYTGNLPENGTIKFQIARVNDVSTYSIKIFEVRDVNGKLCQWQLYEHLQQELNTEMATKKHCVFDVDVGSWYVYHSLKDDAYLRCVVLKVISVEKITKRAMTFSISCLDTGAKFDISSSFLYKLPPKFAKIPPQVIDVYLANVVPLDHDSTWSYYCKTMVNTLLQKANYDHENAYATGQILLRLTNKLWLKNVIVYQNLESNDLSVCKLNLRKTLVDKAIVNIDENCLDMLYQLCEKCGINLPSYAIKVKAPNLKGQPKPQWAHFDDSDCIQIFISYVVSPSLFYARIVKFYDIFEDFQEEIQERLQKPFYPEVGDIFVNKICLVKDEIGGDFTRCMVTSINDDQVKVFLVDYGNYATTTKSELKYLPDEYITKLPFQAIECRLYGIEPDWDKWDNSAIERLRDFMFEPNESYFRILHMNIYKREEATTTGGLNYAVVIADDFNGDLIVINNMLIDEGKAGIVNGEDFGEFQKPKFVEEMDDEEESPVDIEREMTIEEIREEQKRHLLNDREESLNEDIEEVTDEPQWDIEIHRPEDFFKDLLNVRDNALPKSILRALPSSENHDTVLPTTVRPQSHYTPSVIWYQTDTHIKLKLAIPCLEKCEINVIRQNALIFEGVTTNQQVYKLNLFLYDRVLKEFDHKVTGQAVTISLMKKLSTEWSRLTAHEEKARYITYDYTKVGQEEERRRKFLDLGGDRPDEIPDDELVYFTGSEYDSDSDSVEFEN